MRAGFIGLGHMGAPMCANILAAGHDLVVHDIRPDAAQYGDGGGEMLPVRLLEDLTGTALRLAPGPAAVPELFQSG